VVRVRGSMEINSRERINIKSTKYLYDIDSSDLEDKLYFDALEYKLEAGRRLYRELFLKHDKTKEEEDRMFYVAKAQRHTEKLLEERE